MQEKDLIERTDLRFKAAKPAGRRKSCVPENRLRPDAAERRKIAAPFDLRRWSACRLLGEAHSPAVPGAG